MEGVFFDDPFHTFLARVLVAKATAHYGDGPKIGVLPRRFVGMKRSTITGY